MEYTYFILLLIGIDIYQTSIMWSINKNNGDWEPISKENPISIYEANPLCRKYVQFRNSNNKNVLQYLIEYRIFWFTLFTCLKHPYHNEITIIITSLIVLNNYIVLASHYQTIQKNIG